MYVSRYVPHQVCPVNPQIKVVDSLRGWYMTLYWLFRSVELTPLECIDHSWAGIHWEGETWAAADFVHYKGVAGDPAVHPSVGADPCDAGVGDGLWDKGPALDSAVHPDSGCGHWLSYYWHWRSHFGLGHLGSFGEPDGTWWALPASRWPQRWWPGENTSQAGPLPSPRSARWCRSYRPYHPCPSHTQHPPR